MYSRSAHLLSGVEQDILDRTSPFRNGQDQVHDINIVMTDGHMGMIVSERGEPFVIRIACQHMAYGDLGDAADCRFGCEDKAVKRKEMEDARIARWER